MSRDTHTLLAWIEQLIHRKTGESLNQLQLSILAGALDQENRKTYAQIAEDCGYSPGYMEQGVGPKL